MKEFFDVMQPAERIYWYVAIGASVFFVIQTIMTFIGADADTGGDADFDGNLDNAGDQPFQLFSLRNLINFLLGVGWTGVAFNNLIGNKIVLGLVACIVGLVFIGIFFLIMRSLIKLSEDNTFKIEDAVGKTGDVYITIPALKSGKGKVTVSIKGSTHELDAVTSNDQPLKSGSLIKVIDCKDNILVVESEN